VDLYVGGTEHAVGHLLYSRMWVKALYDLGLIGFDEPYKKLLNQGMIQGSSRFVYRLGLIHAQVSNDGEVPAPIKLPNIFISKKWFDNYSESEVNSFLLESGRQIFKRHNPNIKNPPALGFPPQPIHVDVNLVDGIELDVDAFKKWKADFIDAEFILEDNKYVCGTEIEKMSKSKVNTVNPDDIVEKFGADTFRMYEMFLGPVEMSKPWDTKGIEGVHRFLKKLWRLFFDEQKGKLVTEEKATNEELKVLHRTIKKIEEDTERYSYNTAVSTFMVCVNELTDLKCRKKEILEPLLILLAPYAPHIAEELYHQIGSSKVSPNGGDLEGAASTILDASFPKLEEKYLVETTKEYPISVNGKLRTTINIDLNAAQPQVEEIVLANPVVQKWIEGKQPKKIIFVKGKMVNVVI
jgi:leucyl-tRNA synthetase